MNRFPFFLLILLCFSSSAQDYRNICSAGTTLYMNADSNMKAFRLDAYAILGPGDTIFYSYPVIGQILNISGCFDTAMGSVLGRKIYKKSDGWFWFFNASGDTLKLMSQAVPGQSWRFCNLAGTDWLQATFSSAVTENILGTSDPVKVFTLQAKNQGGTNITSVFNQKTIKLSQHFGLVRMMDVNFFTGNPDTTVFLLAGKTAPAIGLQPISWKDVFNFEVGDEFHFYRNFFSTMNGGNERRINRVLERIVYGNWDSVSYRMEQCLVMDYGPPATHYTHFDTTWVSYDFVELSADSSLSRLPYEFSPEGFLCAQFEAFKGYQGRLVKKITPTVFGRANDSCWSFLVGDMWTTRGFAAGLGKVSDVSQGLAYTNNDQMVYFKKGSEIWGTPVSSSCGKLVPVSQDPMNEPVSVTVSPNPVKGSALVTFQSLRMNEMLQFILIDHLGRTAYRSAPFTGSTEMRTSQLPAGIYILQAETSSGVVRMKIIVR
jgi:hypothetical protein